MTIKDIETKLSSKEYDFLKTDKNLGKNIILLTLGGSYAYGTNTENSDLDIRGCALNTKRQLLTNEKFEQFVNEKTDTTIYSFNKLIPCFLIAILIPSRSLVTNRNTIFMCHLLVRNYLIMLTYFYLNGQYIHLADMRTSSCGGWRIKLID